LTTKANANDQSQLSISHKSVDFCRQKQRHFCFGQENRTTPISKPHNRVYQTVKVDQQNCRTSSFICHQLDTAINVANSSLWSDQFQVCIYSVLQEELVYTDVT